jgi:FkbM family methyltransferase
MLEVREHLNLAAYVASLHLRPGDIVYDVGANSGEVTKALASVVGIAGHVYAFEPNAEIIAALNSSKPSNVTVIEKAVSDNCGFATLYLDERDNTGAVASSLMMLNGMEGHTHTVTVETITIDEYSAQCGIVPDLIKIDVEGFEPNVIAGAEKTIKRRKPIIIFELWETHWERYRPTIGKLSNDYHLIRTSNGQAAMPYYGSEGASGVDDILCVPLR